MATPREIWFTHPGTDWAAHGQPVGNGRLGAMMLGGRVCETIQFNEQSLWSGSSNYDNGLAGAPDDSFDTGALGFGSYLNCGEITVEWSCGPVSDAPFERHLALGNGLWTSLTDGFTREVFASMTDDVIVIIQSAPVRTDLSVTLHSAQEPSASRSPTSGSVEFYGQLSNGLRHRIQVRVHSTDGRVAVSGNSSLQVSQATYVVLLLDVATDYVLDAAKGWRDPMRLQALDARLDSAQQFTLEQLRSRHSVAFAQQLGDCALELDQPDLYAMRSLPTDIRLNRYAAHRDVDLEATLFDFGRYLLASSSRPGGLPANLQGLWNDSNSPAWASDYHTNINMQMAYWGAEVTGLADCHLPLFDFVEQVSIPSRVATVAAFGDVPGWTARTSQSPNGGNGWEWNTIASAWLARHFFDHWDFTRDSDFLVGRCLPILSDICRFWVARLIRNPTTDKWEAPQGWSPEHGPRENGVSHDQQIVWDLFTNFLEAADSARDKLSDADRELVRLVGGFRDHLAGPRVGRWGQLQEWSTDRDELYDVHRHTSHLFAVYPGRQITNSTPRLAQAALVSLLARCGRPPAEDDHVASPLQPHEVSGDSRRSWTWPWRAALFARLRRPQEADAMLRGLLLFNTLPSLLTTHPPMQVDGVLGITGAIAEMLIHSHEGTIVLLPALPPSWRTGGRVTGLRVRGGWAIDMAWHDGRVTSYQLRRVCGTASDPPRIDHGSDTAPTLVRY